MATRALSRLWIRTGLAGALFTVASAGSCSVSYKSCTSHDPDDPCHQQHGEDSGIAGGAGGGFGVAEGSGGPRRAVPGAAGASLLAGSSRSPRVESRPGTAGRGDGPIPRLSLPPYWLWRAAQELSRRPDLAAALADAVRVEVRAPVAGAAHASPVAVVYGFADGAGISLWFDPREGDWLGSARTPPAQRQASSASLPVDHSSLK